MRNSLVTNKRKHEYFNEIYDSLHPCYDSMSRIYNKSTNDNDFQFKDDTLLYSKEKDLDFNKISSNSFKTFDKNELALDSMNVHNKISYYLSNNVVPVNYFLC